VIEQEIRDVRNLMETHLDNIKMYIEANTPQARDLIIERMYYIIRWHPRLRIDADHTHLRQDENHQRNHLDVVNEISRVINTSLERIVNYTEATHHEYMLHMGTLARLQPRHLTREDLDAQVDELKRFLHTRIRTMLKSAGLTLDDELNTTEDSWQVVRDDVVDNADANAEYVVDHIAQENEALTDIIHDRFNDLQEHHSKLVNREDFQRNVTDLQRWMNSRLRPLEEDFAQYRKQALDITNQLGDAMTVLRELQRTYMVPFRSFHF
jgi:hemerythrin-like domain-containing protein